MNISKLWLLFAVATTVFWGIWGALIEIPQKAGFPATLGYIVWALTMIPCALIALSIVKWEINTDKRSVFLGSTVGFLGAGGQLILFQALREGPAYIIFPFISLYPTLTILLSVLILKEKAKPFKWIGIVGSLIAIFFLSYQEPGDFRASGLMWIVMSLMVFFSWGLQAFTMKFSNESMKSESIFFYMTITALALTPAAWFMTDFSQPINWSFTGPWLAAAIQMLNSAGALLLVYALKHGKAIIVVPLTGLAPVFTILLSLLIYGVMPSAFLFLGIGIAIIAIIILAFE